MSDDKPKLSHESWPPEIRDNIYDEPNHIRSLLSSVRINTANRLLNEARDVIAAEAREREDSVRDLLEDAADDIGKILVALEGAFGDPGNLGSAR
jgi:hypothetical protein